MGLGLIFFMFWMDWVVGMEFLGWVWVGLREVMGLLGAGIMVWCGF